MKTILQCLSGDAAKRSRPPMSGLRRSRPRVEARPRGSRRCAAGAARLRPGLRDHVEDRACCPRCATGSGAAGAAHGAVDDEIRHMDALGPQFTRRALRRGRARPNLPVAKLEESAKTASRWRWLRSRRMAPCLSGNVRLAACCTARRPPKAETSMAPRDLERIARDRRWRRARRRWHCRGRDRAAPGYSVDIGGQPRHAVGGRGVGRESLSADFGRKEARRAWRHCAPPSATLTRRLAFAARRRR